MEKYFVINSFPYVELMSIGRFELFIGSEEDKVAALKPDDFKCLLRAVG